MSPANNHSFVPVQIKVATDFCCERDILFSTLNTVTPVPAVICTTPDPIPIKIICVPREAKSGGTVTYIVELESHLIIVPASLAANVNELVCVVIPGNKLPYNVVADTVGTFNVPVNVGEATGALEVSIG